MQTQIDTGAHDDNRAAEMNADSGAAVAPRCGFWSSKNFKAIAGFTLLSALICFFAASGSSIKEYHMRRSNASDLQASYDADYGAYFPTPTPTPKHCKSKGKGKRKSKGKGKGRGGDDDDVSYFDDVFDDDVLLPTPLPTISYMPTGKGKGKGKSKSKGKSKGKECSKSGKGKGKGSKKKSSPPTTPPKYAPVRQ